MTHFFKIKHTLLITLLLQLSHTPLAASSIENDIIMKENETKNSSAEEDDLPQTLGELINEIKSDPTKGLKVIKKIVKKNSFGNYLKRYNNGDSKGAFLKELCKVFYSKPLYLKHIVNIFVKTKLVPQPDGFATHGFILINNKETERNANSVTLSHAIAQEAAPIITTCALLTTLFKTAPGFKEKLEDSSHWNLKQISTNWILLIPHPSEKLTNSTRMLNNLCPPTEQELALGFFVEHMPTIKTDTIASYNRADPSLKNNAKLLQELIDAQKNAEFFVPNQWYKQSNFFNKTSIALPRWVGCFIGHGRAPKIVTNSFGKKIENQGLIIGASPKSWQTFLSLLGAQTTQMIGFSLSCFDRSNVKNFSLPFTIVTSTKRNRNLKVVTKRAPLFSLFFKDFFKKEPSQKGVFAIIENPFDKTLDRIDALIYATQIPIATTWVFKGPITIKKHAFFLPKTIPYTIQTFSKLATEITCKPKGFERLPGLFILNGKNINKLTIEKDDTLPADTPLFLQTPAIIPGYPWTHLLSIENVTAPHLDLYHIIDAFYLPLFQVAEEIAIHLKSVNCADASNARVCIIKAKKDAETRWFCNALITLSSGASIEWAASANKSDIKAKNREVRRIKNVHDEWHDYMLLCNVINKSDPKYDFYGL